jgi:hypothetical protein
VFCERKDELKKKKKPRTIVIPNLGDHMTAR